MPTVTLTLDVDASRLDVARQLIEGIKGVKIRQEPSADVQRAVDDLKASIQEVNDIEAGKKQGLDARTALADLQRELHG